MILSIQRLDLIKPAAEFAQEIFYLIAAFQQLFRIRLALCCQSGTSICRGLHIYFAGFNVETHGLTEMIVQCPLYHPDLSLTEQGVVSGIENQVNGFGGKLPGDGVLGNHPGYTAQIQRLEKVVPGTAGLGTARFPLIAFWIRRRTRRGFNDRRLTDC